MLERHVQCVHIQIRDGVGIDYVARIPLIRDAFGTAGVLEVSVVSSDTVKRFEDFTVELATWVLFGLVGHETVDERPRCRLGDHTSKRRIEKVWVVVNTVLELVVALICEQLQVVVVLGLAKVVERLESLQDKVVILSFDVEVTPGRRSIALILVVRARDTLGLAEQVEWNAHAGVWSTDGPADKIAIDSSSIDSQDGGEINAHTKDLKSVSDHSCDVHGRSTYPFPCSR